MRKMTAIEVITTAGKLSDRLMCNHSLKNAKKIAYIVWKNLQTEEKRRKKLKKYPEELS